MAFQTHLKEQDDHADFGRHGKRFGGLQRLHPRNAQQHQVSQKDTDDQFAEYRGLAQAFKNFAARLGREDHDHQPDQKIVQDLSMALLATRRPVGANAAKEKEEEQGNSFDGQD